MNNVGPSTTTTTLPFRWTLGVGALLIEDKPNGVIHFGIGTELLQLELEAGLIWATPKTQADRFLGSPLNAHLMVAPIRLQGLEVRGGLGLETYYLWNIHRKEARYALGALADATYHPVDSLGVRVGARTHLLESDGLDIGTHHNGDRGLFTVFNVALVYRGGL